MNQKGRNSSYMGEHDDKQFLFIEATTLQDTLASSASKPQKIVQHQFTFVLCDASPIYLGRRGPVLVKTIINQLLAPSYTQLPYKSSIFVETTLNFTLNQMKFPPSPN